MNPVAITRNGATYTGSYGVQGHLLVVTYAGQTKRTQIGDMEAQTLAEIVLGEMIGS
ncbi:hypothetical protein HW561_04690 [Rhodobacteraceae bacterium B1Z28]|uniref:Uncharacterized protein n=1 Tax=Ruegeria haliotis TaxID=2747601 RepID=A0ABX2PND1_9RHOB|nr:hypothetical protein [Ruegeria haliotis]NVO55087.1 hypothetical protein [Ruegeria haliotis]